MTGAEFHRQAMEDALTEAAELVAVDRKAIAFAEAQVHATALVAEEQRTANLIAAFERDAISAPAADITTAERHAYWNGIADDITKRLGLA